MPSVNVTMAMMDIGGGASQCDFDDSTQFVDLKRHAIDCVERRLSKKGGSREAAVPTDGVAPPSVTGFGDLQVDTLNLGSDCKDSDTLAMAGFQPGLYNYLVVRRRTAQQGKPPPLQQQRNIASSSSSSSAGGALGCGHKDPSPSSADTAAPGTASSAPTLAQGDSNTANGDSGTMPAVVTRCLLFPGQGAQEAGMADSLYSSCPEAKALFDRASKVMGVDMMELCRDPARLAMTEHCQPAIFVTSLAAVESLRLVRPDVVDIEEIKKKKKKEEEEGGAAAATVVAPLAVAGLSLGEFSALVFAGAIDFEDGLRLVVARAKAMQAASDLGGPAGPAGGGSGMLAVLGIDDAAVAACCTAASRPGDPVTAANYLMDGNVACSGSKAGLDRLEEETSAASPLKARRLPVSGGFHSSFMAPSAHVLEAALRDCPIRAPAIPVISNVTAKPHSSDPEEIRATLLKQLTSPVQWSSTMDGLLEAGVEECFEVGPGVVCTNIMRRLSRKTGQKVALLASKRNFEA